MNFQENSESESNHIYIRHFENMPNYVRPMIRLESEIFLNLTKDILIEFF